MNNTVVRRLEWERYVLFNFAVVGSMLGRTLGAGSALLYSKHRKERLCDERTASFR